MLLQRCFSSFAIGPQYSLLIVIIVFTIIVVVIVEIIIICWNTFITTKLGSLFAGFLPWLAPRRETIGRDRCLQFLMIMRGVMMMMMMRRRRMARRTKRVVTNTCTVRAQL